MDAVELKGKPRVWRQTRGEEQQEATAALSSQQSGGVRRELGPQAESESVAGSAWWSMDGVAVGGTA